ncbi:aminotransferase class I/II-fold pyridoxal phosphate-dependent enzyme [Microvirga sp. STR05]|uniref:Aminotransferase class I/II-fold pyridoxal phosphate-dependent enzyme n=1 Tax=Hymenobacter duratus TaxID=2771356 RepID=A0ABR8JJB5_9BACT|nr:aminotransferase class I/II-fold pyridoxal phosphate-dependent enzyme [Hymenobacter duratus]MBD2715798.1 aminotransferase class I/II-fold pyridoxal phosphate-dependent enzyme [Hymenobacter duratus]MBR7950709.1 aminotransferase class I/II-fold pyridoxal phosphate-dependent enzyme [Microvirga sp. STR05]
MRSQDHDRIYLSPPHLGRHELNYLHKAIEDNWVAPAGPNLAGFERDICEFTGAEHCVALTSGTAAIHLGLKLLGVGPGDEVLCPSFTFVATANPILYLGARPVFIDSEAETWNLCPERLREAIEDRMRLGRRPKALIIVHLYGMPCKLREILAVAAEFDIPVLEDAAEALGSRYDGQPLGTFGAVGVFSFNGNKILTTSAGGALVTRNAAWDTKVRFWATQSKDPAPYYQHSEIGYNYRLSNLLAGIGRGQMELLEDRVKRRREIYGWYQQHLAEIPALSLGPTEPAGGRSNRWLTCVLLAPTQTIVAPEPLRLHLETRNIESRPLWKPLHLQPLFADAPMYGGAVCTNLFDQGLCLPSGTAMTESDLRRVADALKEITSAEQT